MKHMYGIYVARVSNDVNSFTTVLVTVITQLPPEILMTFA